MITRNPSLTDQVKAHLKERIAEGAFVDGRIPPEADLAAELGVSRTTVRDALSRLEHEGAIYRRQGAGTFVNEHGLQIKSRLEEIWSYEQVLEEHGYTPSVSVLDERTEVADESTAAALDLGVDEKVRVIEKLFREDDTPVILTVNRIPDRLIPADDVLGDEATPVYDFLERHTGRALAWYLSEIVPVSLDGITAGKLGLPRGTAAISFDEVGYDTNNEPIVRATSFFRDDLLRFRLIRRRG
jgi:GntR family transcriptional regulator